MPAPLAAPSIKRDTRFYKADLEFLDQYLDGKGMTTSELARELVHRYANAKRGVLGLPPEAPHPPGLLP